MRDSTFFSSDLERSCSARVMAAEEEVGGTTAVDDGMEGCCLLIPVVIAVDVTKLDAMMGTAVDVDDDGGMKEMVTVGAVEVVVVPIAVVVAMIDVVGG